MIPQYHSLREFYPDYLAEHSRPAIVVHLEGALVSRERDGVLQKQVTA